MRAVIKLTGYEKTTEWLVTAMTVPAAVVKYARTVAGVPKTDPDVLAVYPLTVEQAQAIAHKSNLPLDLDRFDYCLEAIAEDRRAHAQNV